MALKDATDLYPDAPLIKMEAHYAVGRLHASQDAETRKQFDSPQSREDKIFWVHVESDIVHSALGTDGDGNDPEPFDIAYVQGYDDWAAENDQPDFSLAHDTYGYPDEDD